MRKTALFLAAMILLSFQAFARGIVVESARKGDAGERAGIKEGDLLLSWERLPNPPSNPEKHGGEFRSPFDLWWVEKEEASRGRLVFTGAEKSFQVPPGDFWIQSRPDFQGQALTLYNEGNKLMNGGKLEEGMAIFEKAAALLKKDKEQACWLYFKAAQNAAAKKDPEKAILLYGKAKDMALETKDPRIAAMIWTFLGRVYQGRNDFPKAGECFNESLAAAERAGGENLAASFVMNCLGILYKDLGDLSKTEEYFRKALAIREKIAPESLDQASSLNNMGLLVKEKGNFAESERYQKRSMAIIEKLNPESLQFANALNNLGLFAYDRGNFAEAEKYYERSVSIMRRLAPESLSFAAGLTNMGALALDRGDLVKAEELMNESLALREKLAPDSLDVAACLNNLGVIAKERGEFAEAERYYARALAIKEKLSPGSLAVWTALTNLGELEHLRGDLAKAGEYFDRSLALREKIAPESLGVSDNLLYMGALAMDSGDAAKAGECFGKALAILEKLAPESLFVATCFEGFGMLAEAAGDLPKAEENFKKSLAIKEALAPGSTGHAQVLYSLGTIYRKKSDLPQALSYLQKAVSSLESQKVRLGGGRETKEKFSSKYADYYRDLVEVETELKKNGEAFDTLEKYRARNLLEMLAERDLDFSSDAPAELLQKQKELLVSLGRKQDELQELSPEKDAAKVNDIRKSLDELNREADGIREEIKRSSPRLASLQYPEALDAAAVRKLVGSGVLFLSYSCGEKKTVLFALRSGDLSVWTIPVEREKLRDDVAGLRRALTDPGSDAKFLAEKRGRLYDLVLKPAAKLIGSSDLVVICPDGPLHYLPFCALMKKPSVNVISATVLKELGETSASRQAGALVAFGNPDYPAKEAEDASVRSVTLGQPLASLPATEIEVDSIGSLFGNRATILTKTSATEERAKSVGRDVSLLHFACHGILNERFPLDSGLALTIPGRTEKGRDNGLLQAWEIFEGMRINADLVTLSACETGLGKEMGGEGLIGLTRAFQYAGAKTVLSSLWSVSDDSTAILMKNFYSGLKEGRTKAEALRLAQTEMSRSKKYRHPFYWAGFVLNGDWR